MSRRDQPHINMSSDRMTDEQASYLKSLAQRAFEPKAFQPALDQAEAASQASAARRTTAYIVTTP